MEEGDGYDLGLFSHIICFGEDGLPGDGSGNGSFSGYGMGYETGTLVGDGYGRIIMESYF